MFGSNFHGLAPEGGLRPEKFINLATLGPSALASRGTISISIRMCSVNRCDISISISISIRKRKLFLFLTLMLMPMSRYHKCEPVRHKHKHKHNEAAVFDISGNIIENSAQSLPADLQFQDGVFHRFFGKISRSCSHLSLLFPTAGPFPPLLSYPSSVSTPSKQ